MPAPPLGSHSFGDDLRDRIPLPWDPAHRPAGWRVRELRVNVPIDQRVNPGALRPAPVPGRRSAGASPSRRLCRVPRAPSRSTRTSRGASTRTSRSERSAGSDSASPNTLASSARSAADHHSWTGPWSRMWAPGRRCARRTAWRTTRRFAGRAIWSRASRCPLRNPTCAASATEPGSNAARPTAPTLRADPRGYGPRPAPALP